MRQNEEPASLKKGQDPQREKSCVVFVAVRVCLQARTELVIRPPTMGDPHAGFFTVREYLRGRAAFGETQQQWLHHPPRFSAPFGTNYTVRSRKSAAPPPPACLISSPTSAARAENMVLAGRLAKNASRNIRTHTYTHTHTHIHTHTYIHTHTHTHARTHTTRTHTHTHTHTHDAHTHTHTHDAHTHTHTHTHTHIHTTCGCA
jgi:hypothetical protein